MLTPNDDEVVFSRAPVSAEVLSLSRTNSSLIVNRLTDSGHEPVAKVLGSDRSTVTKWAAPDGLIDRFALMLSALDLKVVPKDWEVVDMEQVQAMFTLSKARVNSIKSIHELIVEGK